MPDERPAGRAGGNARTPGARPRRWIGWVIALLVALLIPVPALWLLQRRLIFQPDISDPGPAAAAVAGARDVLLHTGDGLRLAAWYLPAKPGCDTTVLVAPGNAGNRAGRAEMGRRFGERGLGVLLLDYRGYGGNPGRPTEAGLALDALAAWEFLDRSLGAGHRLIYFGESLGGAVVTALALVKPPDALILRSPFVDLASAAQQQFPAMPVRFMLWDKFPVQQLISRVAAPLTVVFGDRDRVIPPEQSLIVAEAAAGAATVVAVPGADHNDPELVHGPAVIDAVQRGVCGAT